MRWFTLNAVALTACSSFSSAAVIVGYDASTIPSSPIPTTFAATSADTGITGVSLSRGAGLTPIALTRGFSSSNWSTTATSFDAAVAANNYYEFGFTVQPGYKTSLSTVNVNLRRSSTAAAGIAEYLYSFDNFATSAVAGTFTATAAADPGEAQPAVDLSGISGLQNIPAGTTVTFRLLAYGATTATSTVAIGRPVRAANSANDLQIVGTTTTPEPTALAVVGAGAVAVLRRRRRAVSE